MSEPVNPLRKLVLGSLCFTWCWAVIAASVGLNALIESIRSQQKLRGSLPPIGGQVVNLLINIDDVSHTGLVATILSTLIGGLASTFVLASLIPKTRALTTRTLHYQAYALAFCGLALFATMIPFTHFFQTRSAEVRAFVGPVELPEKIVKAAEKALGATSEYRRIPYLRLVAIFPWFSGLFTIISATILLMASSRVRNTSDRGKPLPSVYAVGLEKNSKVEMAET